MAAYDTPVMIDYVLNATGQRQIHLIAYSMGATVSFAMLSTKLEYNNKVTNASRHIHYKNPII